MFRLAIIYTAFLLGVSFLALSFFENDTKQDIKPHVPVSTSTSSSTSSTFTSTTMTSTSSTTSTTLFEMSILDVGWFNAEKCRHTVIGNMNTILVEVTAEAVRGTWGRLPQGNFLYSCDGGPLTPVDGILYRGGASISHYHPLEGQYRLRIRCGRNAHISDVTSCKDLEVFLDLEGLNVTGYGGLDIDPASTGYEPWPKNPSSVSPASSPVPTGSCSLCR